MNLGSTPRIAIRVDASTTIGTGHLKRCLSLAESLLEAGAEICFVCRLLDEVASQILRHSPHKVHWLPTPKHAFEPETKAPPCAAWAGVSQSLDAKETAEVLNDYKIDWVVVDHYSFDVSWHRYVHHALDCRLLVIDDTADRCLAPDVLLNHNWNVDHCSMYAGLLQSEPVQLYGPRYALIARRYQHAQRHVVRDAVSSIGIFMGGADPEGASVSALAACRHAGFYGWVEVASTSANPHLTDLRHACANDGHASLLTDAPDLVEFFLRHDIQIGAAGGATWERCCLATPTIALALSSNQTSVLPGLVELGAVRKANFTTLASAISDLIADPEARRELSHRAKALVDGRGSQRVAVVLSGVNLQLRSATAMDAVLLHRWRNHPAVRGVSMTQDPISLDDHCTWLNSVLANPTRRLFVAQIGMLPVGSIRFDGNKPSEYEVSLYVDPDLIGLGLGRQILLRGERAMLSLDPAGYTSKAVVLPDNTASQRLFTSAGYSGGPTSFHKVVFQK